MVPDPISRVVRDFRDALGERHLIVVSNREPYEHRWDADGVDLAVRRPAGGLTSALDPVLRAAGGTWVAWGSGDADPAAVDEDDRLLVPPEEPAYLLRRVWLADHDIRRYYLGYSNQLLWPLCHMRTDLVRVSEPHWLRYQEVNRRFAEATLEEAAGRDAAVWFQDYHLALAPRLVRERRPDLSLAHFWHIPFPPPDILRMVPHAADLLRGLLANDLVGFQIPRFQDNFLRCAEELAGAAVDHGKGVAVLGGHRCQTGAFPISIDVEQFRSAADRPEPELRALRSRLAPAGGLIGLGVDRLDYSKGLMQKLDALARLWELNPELRRRFSFVQVAVPSRMDIESYDRLGAEVERCVEAINRRFGSPDWCPITLVKDSIPAETLASFYRVADLCLITSLQDGMNLVAKEFVACQLDRQGVLVLSEFAGAAHELDGAVLINPRDAGMVSAAIVTALHLPAGQRALAMGGMQDGLRTVYQWMSGLISAWGSALAVTALTEP